MNTDLINEETLNFVRALSHRYAKYYDRQDLEQAGVIGLAQAARTYDPTRGTKFTTHAYRHILGEMIKLRDANKHAAKVSRGINSLNNQIEYERQILTQKLMREPTNYDVAKSLGIKESTVEETINATAKAVSLDEPLNDNGKEITYADTIPNKEPMSKDDYYFLKEQLLALPKEERRLIGMRYFRDQTQQETANKMNMSQVQVSRLESKVLKKIRKNYC